jgi:predicted thioesterase
LDDARVTLSPGLVGEIDAVVDRSMLASTLGSGGLDVLATPALIALMEHAARNAVEPHLAADQTTVGVHVDVRHLAASPLGAQLRVRAELIELSGRRLIFRVEAFDAHEKIGEGTHERAIVDPARLLSRAAAKLPHD